MRKVWAALATIGLGLFLVTTARPAFAQCGRAEPAAEADWQRYLSRHPGLAEHPEWLRNPRFTSEHPNMTKWLHAHPNVLACAREQGMWDKRGGWHDADWWRDHHPDWMYENHEDWVEAHPQWHGPNDGDWDDQHHWHPRHWWVQEHREWVKNHHPNWMRYNHAEPDHED